MTVRLRVAVSPASALPGDDPWELDLDAPARPEIESTGSGTVVVRSDGGAGEAAAGSTIRAAVGPSHRTPRGATVVEVVVDGWRFELEVEDAARAALRRRATRERDTTAASGPTDIRAIIPGRIAAVHVAAGDVVEAGQSLLVVEAMKMQNELRAPRDGSVERVAVAEGETIDNGDLLVVIR